MNIPIVVTGSIAIDRIMRFKGLYKDFIQPEKLDTLSISLFLEEQFDSYGGVGANIAYSLALLGEKPILLGSVGIDGKSYMEHLGNLGVDMSHVHFSQLPTAAFNVISDSTQCQLGGFYPGAMFDSDSLVLDPWKDERAIVIVSPHDPKMMKRQIKQARQYGHKLIYDIGQQVSNAPAEDINEGVEAADILILNDYEIAALSKKIGIGARDLLKQVPVVITTLGEEGCLIGGTAVEETIEVKAVKADKVEDVTGAGDAFRAGFLYGYAREWPLKVCAQLGATTAVYAVESTGTQNHNFTLGEVTKRYQKTYRETLPSN